MDLIKFTKPGSYTWTVPPGVESAKFILRGGADKDYASSSIRMHEGHDIKIRVGAKGQCTCVFISSELIIEIGQHDDSSGSVIIIPEGSCPVIENYCMYYHWVMLIPGYYKYSIPADCYKVHLDVSGGGAYHDYGQHEQNDIEVDPGDSIEICVGEGGYDKGGDSFVIIHHRNTTINVLARGGKGHLDEQCTRKGHRGRVSILLSYNESYDNKPRDWVCRDDTCNFKNPGNWPRCFKCGKLKICELQSKILESEPKHKCTICFDREINTTIIKCGHLKYCYECALNMKTCAHCRVPYNPDRDLLRVYI